MIEKIGHIKNPLTIIAMFAAIAEISGTGVLPFITPASQATYVWFLILFPPYLVGLFFLTLWFRPTVLYAPSDFVDEQNYLRLFSQATVAEVVEKEREDLDKLEDCQSENAFPTMEGERGTENSNASESDPPTEKLEASDRIAAEALALREIARQYPSAVRDVKFSNFVFDAVAQQGDQLTIFDVMMGLNPSRDDVIGRARKFIMRVEKANLPAVAPALVLLVVSKEKPEHNYKRVQWGFRIANIRYLTLDETIPVPAGV